MCLCACTSFTAFFIQTERSCTRLRSNLCHCRLGWACSTHLAPRPRSEYAHRGLGTARNSPRPVPSGSWRGPSPLPPAQRASTTGGGEPRCCCHPSPPYSPAQRTSPPDVPLSLPPNLCTIRHRGMAHRARPGRCLAGRAQGSPSPRRNSLLSRCVRAHTSEPLLRRVVDTRASRGLAEGLGAALARPRRRQLMQGCQGHLSCAGMGRGATDRWAVGGQTPRVEV